MCGPTYIARRTRFGRRRSLVCERHPSGLELILDDFRSALAIFETFPGTGRKRPGLSSNLRSFAVHPYLVFYEVRERERVVAITRLSTGASISTPLISTTDLLMATVPKHHYRRLAPWNDKQWHDQFTAVLGSTRSVLDLGCGSGLPVAGHLEGTTTRDFRLAATIEGLTISQTVDARRDRSRSAHRRPAP